MVTKRIPKAKVSESTRYRMEADTVSGVAEIEKKVIKDTKESLDDCLLSKIGLFIIAHAKKEITLQKMFPLFSNAQIVDI